MRKKMRPNPFHLCFLGLLWLWLFTAIGCATKETEWSPEISAELTLLEEVSLEYATEFQLYQYEGGYRLLRIPEGNSYLITPYGKEVPKDLPEDITVLQEPTEHIYLAATAVMDMFQTIGAMDTLTFSGQEEDGWYIEEAKKKMQEGTLLYAGKYNMPDYEKLLAEGCSLAIESTMILHAPEVMEKLQGFGIPVLVDYSSYEQHPLGRVEWVKFYGALLGKEEEAKKAFEEQKQLVEGLTQAEEEEKPTVAFFYVTGNGAVSVRKGSDYIPKMIELAGGTYCFASLEEEGKHSSSMNMQMEEFYAGAREADYLVYNGTIDGGISKIGDLLEKSSLFADFKAVKEGKVYGAKNNIYQQSMSIGNMMEDFDTMLHDTPKEMKYLYHVE